MRDFFYCKTCSTNIDRRCLNKEGEEYLCPVCNTVLWNEEREWDSEKQPESWVDLMKEWRESEKQAIEKELAKAELFALTPDEIRYTIHSLTKQETKLKNALKQVHSTVTKLMIMLETALEKESN